MSKPDCAFGAACIRQNPAHFEEFNHPPGFKPLTKDSVAKAGSDLFVSRFFTPDTSTLVQQDVVDVVSDGSDDKPALTKSPKKRVLPVVASAKDAAEKPKGKAKGGQVGSKAPSKRKKTDILLIPADKPAGDPATGMPGKLKKGPTVNHNEKLTTILVELARIERANGDMHRSNAYYRAVTALKSHPVPVTSGAEAKQLKGIGDSIARKIDEILSTGKLRKLEESKADEHTTALRELERVHGIGPVFAKKLVDEHHIKTLADLGAHPELLNVTQVIGLKYVDEFEQRIPRTEVQAIEALLLREVAKVNPKLHLTVCGSYRRGNPDCGDIDVMITHPDFVSPDGKTVKDPPADLRFLQKFVDHLKETGFITDELSCGPLKFMGVCLCPADALRQSSNNIEAPAAVEAAPSVRAAPVSLSLPSLDEIEEEEAVSLTKRATISVCHRTPGTGVSEGGAGKIDGRTFDAPVLPVSSKFEPIHRRIDIRYFPANCYWCGVLYFTGDSLLNQEMRRIAIEKDLKLSEYCLATREGTGPTLAVTCEKDVFDHLGMKFLEPPDRNMS